MVEWQDISVVLPLHVGVQGTKNSEVGEIWFPALQEFTI